MKPFCLFLGIAIAFLLSTNKAMADGCYICQGQSDAYVKFEGTDSQTLRKQAEACGCDVGGTSGSCSASNHTILCTVSPSFENSNSASGCFMCADGAYVRYYGNDTFDLRHKAEACGCQIQGTSGSCNASNNRVLCSVK